MSTKWELKSKLEWQAIRKVLVRGCLIPVGALMLMIAGCGVVARYTSFDLGLLTEPFKQNPGRFDRARMEAIVEEVRHSGLKPGESQSFILDQAPGTFHRPSSSKAEIYGPYVSALVSSSGDLQVVIVTRNLGHGGSYGFAYSDRPWKPAPSDWGGSSYQLDAPFHVNMCTLDMKIDEHWWRVENTLD